MMYENRDLLSQKRFQKYLQKSATSKTFYNIKKPKKQTFPSCWKSFNYEYFVCVCVQVKIFTNPNNKRN